ncbi:Hypothetical protein (Fragment) [Durusdinium trenchii]|uniref:Uncharacterized protein n=1 Tax=Durusdinium trenchii TaxID=1381693 RepID=A0ABP0HP87_9DINO
MFRSSLAGYCRYNQINIPILDDFIRKALYGDAGGGGGVGDEVANSMADARAGKPIAVSDVLGQMNRYCRRGKCNDDYWEALPDVAKALKMGPGTWDRKPLKKEPPRSEAVWSALRIVSKELLDVTPKSMKESLASRVALKSSKPPEGSVTPEPEKEEEAPWQRSWLTISENAWHVPDKGLTIDKAQHFGG